MDLLDRILATDVVAKTLDRLHEQHGSAEGWSLVAFDTRGEAGRVMFERSAAPGSPMPPVFAGVYRIDDLLKMFPTGVVPEFLGQVQPIPRGRLLVVAVGPEVTECNLLEFKPRAEN